MEADYSMTAQAFGDESEADKKLYVQFYVRAHLDQGKTAEAGRPIYYDREYVRIIAPGDKTNIVDRPVRDLDRTRFPQHYARFKQGMTEQTVGTPLTVVGWLTPAQIEELAYFKIKTVEQLAYVADSVASKMAGLQGLKQKASAFLEAAKGQAPLTKMQAELESRDAQIAALMARLETLEANSEAKAAKGK